MAPLLGGKSGFLFLTYSAPLPIWKGAQQKTIAKSADFYQNLRFGRSGHWFRSSFFHSSRVRLGLDHRCQGGDALVVALEPHHDHALGRTARALDVLHRHQDHLVALTDNPSADEPALAFDELRRLDTQAAAALAWIVHQLRPLPVTVLGHDEQVALVDADDIRGNHLVAFAQAHALDSPGIAAHRASLLLAKANRLALARDHENVVAARRMLNRDELVVIAQLDRDDPVGLEGRVVRRELGLLDRPVLGREDEVLRLLEVPCLDDGTHLFTRTERQQVLDGAPLRLPRAERQLMDLEPIDLADIREEEDVVVCRRDEEVLDVVVLLQVHSHHALTAAALFTIRRHR